jgi:hypothetical protein
MRPRKFCRRLTFFAQGTFAGCPTKSLTYCLANRLEKLLIDLPNKLGPNFPQYNESGSACRSCRKKPRG